MYHIFVIQITFQSFDCVELDYWGFVIRISLNVNSDFQNFRFETRYIADYENISISSFSLLDIKQWLKEASKSDTDCL